MSTDADHLLEGLTEAQRQAVLHIDGPVQVLAGPGSGKTRVITHRIAYLLSQGIPPWSILALTFTNKAAGEMRQRIERMLEGSGHDVTRLTITTFHAFCARMLRRYAEQMGLSPRFTIYDTSDQHEALKRAIVDAGLSVKNWTPGSVGGVISAAKNQLLTAGLYEQQAHDFSTRTIAKIYSGYEAILATAAAVDFDDLLLKMARLLRENDAVRVQLQERFQYVLIDEYQDTNHAQFVIAHGLASGHRNICVVGDPDQSIYAWRGADIRNILEFEEQFPGATLIPLGQNFRSTKFIVAAADALIRHNVRRKHKDLFTELEAGEKLQVIICRDEHHEAELVVDDFQTRRDTGAAWKDMAVLYRVNSLSRVMEEKLRNAQIPYVIARGTAFYDRKEIRDALAYLRVIVNPRDEVSLRRVVNTPARGIGEATIEKLSSFARARGLGLQEAMRHAGSVGGITTRTIGAIGKFTSLIERCRSLASGAREDLLSGEVTDLAGLVEMVIRESGLEEMFRKSKAEEDQERVENLEELVSAAAQFEPPAGEETAEPATTLDVLGAFLESVALVSDAESIDTESGAVTLLTLHAAKGLEYSHVALIGLEQGLLPHSRALTEEKELEEERRLCFVGMTRARRSLMMTQATVRTHRGLSEYTIPSQFLKELPEQAVERRDESGMRGGEEAGLESESGGASGGGWGSSSYDTARDFKAAETALLREFPVGTLVRHPRFGLGRVETIMRQRAGTRAMVSFTAGGTKTLILEYANLQRVK